MTEQQKYIDPSQSYMDSHKKSSIVRKIMRDSALGVGLALSPLLGQSASAFNCDGGSQITQQYDNKAKDIAARSNAQLKNAYVLEQNEENDAQADVEYPVNSPEKISQTNLINSARNKYAKRVNKLRADYTTDLNNNTADEQIALRAQDLSCQNQTSTQYPTQYPAQYPNQLQPQIGNTMQYPRTNRRIRPGRGSISNRHH